MSYFEHDPQLTEQERFIREAISVGSFDADEYMVTLSNNSDYSSGEALVGPYDTIAPELPVGVIGSFITPDNEIVSVAGVNTNANTLPNADLEGISFFTERELLGAQHDFRAVDQREAFEIIDGLGGYEFSKFPNPNERAIFLGGIVTYMASSTGSKQQLLRAELVASRGLGQIKTTLDAANEHIFNIAPNDAGGEVSDLGFSQSAILNPEEIDLLNVYAYTGERHRKTIANIAVIATVPETVNMTKFPFDRVNNHSVN